MKDNVIVGIDIGSSKIATIIATTREDGQLHIIGVSTIDSKGLRKGQVVDIEDAKAAISVSLDAAERMAGSQVSAAFVSVGGSHIASQNSHGVVAVANPEKEITSEDVHRVVDAAKAINLSSSRQILHVLPRGFIVDGQEGIADPVGMTGVRLEVDTHIVTGGVTAVRNLEKCVSELGVAVSGLVFNGFAASSSVLSDTEKELGVVLVDIGGGTTDVAIFVEGALSYSGVIPIGAKNITNDLAIGLRVSLESAEKIKLLLSEPVKAPAMPENHGKKRSELDELDLGNLSLPEDIRKVSRKTLIEGIIKPRLNEIFTMVGLEIKKSGFGGMTPSGLVVCGGGAKTVGVIESARRSLAMPVHIGIPSNVSGLVDEILEPTFAASVGLVQYGVRMMPEETSSSLFNFSNVGKMSTKLPIKGALGRVLDALKSFMP
ncbi:cell division protein FtsA [Candidatus Microgenomates bacterium]|nr:MAG: cell division protein FtsA [Candidatus Microgenomates bacterium]